MFGSKQNTHLPKNQQPTQRNSDEELLQLYSRMDLASTDLSSHCPDQMVSPDGSNEKTVTFQQLVLSGFCSLQWASQQPRCADGFKVSDLLFTHRNQRSKSTSADTTDHIQVHFCSEILSWFRPFSFQCHDDFTPTVCVCNFPVWLVGVLHTKQLCDELVFPVWFWRSWPACRSLTSSQPKKALIVSQTSTFLKLENDYLEWKPEKQKLFAAAHVRLSHGGSVNVSSHCWRLTLDL